MNNKFKFGLLTSFFPLCGMAQGNVIDEVIWVVGDEPILKSEVEEQRLQLEYAKTPLEGDPYCIIPEQMAIQKLFLHQAKIDSVEASSDEIEQRVEAQLAYIISQIGSKEKMEEYFSKSYTDYKYELTIQMRNQSIVRQMQEKIVGDIKLTPAEVRRFYEQIPEDSLPYIPMQVEVQLVAIDPPITFEEKDRVTNKLREIAEQVNKGESEFSTMAMLYSEDVESAKHGGELGFMGRGQLVPEFAQVAFAMQDPKRVSRVVETEYGYHILQFIERRGEKVNCRHILMKPKVDISSKSKTLAKLDSLRQEILSGTTSFEKGAYTFSTDKETKNNGGLMQNQETGDSFFEMQQLPSSIAQKIEPLQVGEISQPFLMVNERSGKEVCVIAKLKTRRLGHKANVGDDYQTILTMLENHRREEILSNWIKQKQKEISISIKEDWANCDFKYPGWIQSK